MMRLEMGSSEGGGGSRWMRGGGGAEGEAGEGRTKGRRGVEGRGAAKGAERRAERALIWGSVRSCTRSWSWNWRRAMILDEMLWFMP